jgi:hypothetical protein
MFVQKFRALRARSAANRKMPVYRSTVPRIKSSQDAFLALTFGVVLIGALNVSAVRADSVIAANQDYTIAQSAPSGKGEGSGRPPREALEACSKAKVNSSCSFDGRNGEAVKGKCLSPKADVPLACVPENMPKKG